MFRGLNGDLPSPYPKPSAASSSESMAPMHRWQSWLNLVAIGAVALVATVASPVMAQYGGGGTGPTPTAGTGGGRAVVSTSVVAAGDTLNISAPAGSFVAASVATLGLARQQAGSPVISVGTGPVNSDGSASLAFTVPRSTAPGIYLVFIEARGGDGQPRAFVAAVTVLAAGTDVSNRAEVAGAAATPVAPAVPTAPGSGADQDPPAAVRQLQGSLNADEESIAVRAVARGGQQALLGAGGVELRPGEVATGITRQREDNAPTPILTLLAGLGVLAAVVVVAVRRRRAKAGPP